MATDRETPSATGDPGYARVRDFLLYSLSLPERALRSVSGVVGGALRESASLLVPQAFQNSKTYCVMVRQMLDFLAVDVGGAPQAHSAQAPNAADHVKHFVARKAVGNFIDLAGWATLHLSPILLLAVISDLAYGSQAYLKELAQDLKRQGLIDRNSTIDHVDDLLDAVALAAGTTSMALNTPPVSVAGLRETIQQTRAALAGVDPARVVPQAELQRLWDEMHQLAATQGTSPLTLSAAVTLFCLNKIGTLGRGALSTVKAAGTLVDRHVLDHYRAALGEIRQRGLYASLAQSCEPYIEAVWQNFSPRKRTFTERLLCGEPIARAWRAIRGWLGREPS